MLRILLRSIAGVFLFVLLAGAYWMFIHTAPPAKRPDLVRVPEALGPAPKGFPSEGALYATFALREMGWYDLDLVDLESEIPIPPGIKEEKDIVYGTGGGESLALDLYSPEALSAPVPGIIFIHGGGWRSGEVQDCEFYTTRVARHGSVVATVSDRLREAGDFP